MTREADRPVVSLQHAVKKFGSFTAMSDGCIELYPHRIHALAGENGAGKSTLVKVLAGIHQPNSGEFLVEGQPVRFKTPAESKAAGISVIYQEPTLFPDLTVAENIYVGRQPRGRFGLIDHAAMKRDTQELFDRLEVPIDPSQLADGLSIADQQIIEIAKAIWTPRSSSWTNRRPLCPGTRSTASSPSRVPCATRGPPSCSSRTGWRKFSTCATT